MLGAVWPSFRLRHTNPTEYPYIAFEHSSCFTLILTNAFRIEFPGLLVV